MIEPGREAEVQELFAPYSLGDVIDGWRFETISIDRDVIHVAVVRDATSDSTTRMTLAHPGDQPGRSASFAITFEAPNPALDTLAQAVETNDQGNFWRAVAERDPIIDMRRLAGASNLTTDGVLWSVLLFFWIVVLALHASRDAPFERRYLVGLVVVAGVVRYVFAPRMLLGAWVFSRSTDLQRWVWESPTLAWLSEGRTFAEIDVMMAIGFAYALVTPLAAFAHGRWILGTPRRGLIAAFVLAALPLHVRFSASEVAFIPSIVLSSTLFATTHFALRSTGKWRVVATVAAAFLTIGVVTARPLNALFLPLIVWVLIGFGEASRKARITIGAVIGFAGIAGGVVMWARFANNVRDGLDLRVLWDALLLIFDLERNTFFNVSMTPILLVGLAVWGAWTLRSTERRRLLFLGAWIAIFFVTHAYVVPRAPAMQARYHLHLVVPFALVIALGARELMGRYRWGSVVFCTYVALSPLLHANFITDVDFNDHREVRFARSFVHVVPEGCTIREVTGHDPRAVRVGAELHNGTHRLRWPLESEECTYYFESLACFANKDRDDALDPACVELRRSARWELVRETSFENRIYDGNLAEGLRVGDIVTLSLYRSAD